MPETVTETVDRSAGVKPKVRWECRMDQDLAEELARNADQTSRTETAVVHRALRAYLARKDSWKH